MRAETFLRLYRVLETALAHKYAPDRSGGYASVVMEYLADPQSEPVRAELNLCRELRNLLTHNVDAEGQSVAEPSKAMLDTLYRIIDFVESPKTALHYATPAAQVLKAHMNDCALPMMRQMHKRGFSHIPVMEGAVLAGVFSVSTVFSYVLVRGALHENTRIRDFDPLLRIERAEERYLILPETAEYPDVRAAFERATGRNRRLVAVFITKNGTAQGELLGMLTPWDVLGKKE